MALGVLTGRAWLLPCVPAAWLSPVPETLRTMIMLASAIRPASVSVIRRPARELPLILLPPVGTVADVGGRWVDLTTARTPGRPPRSPRPQRRRHQRLRDLGRAGECRLCDSLRTPQSSHRT